MSEVKTRSFPTSQVPSARTRKPSTLVLYPCSQYSQAVILAYLSSLHLHTMADVVSQVQATSTRKACGGLIRVDVSPLELVSTRLHRLGTLPKWDSYLDSQLPSQEGSVICSLVTKSFPHGPSNEYLASPKTCCEQFDCLNDQH